MQQEAFPSAARRGGSGGAEEERRDWSSVSIRSSSRLSHLDAAAGDLRGVAARQELETARRQQQEPAYERHSHLGQQQQLGSNSPGKEEVATILNWLRGTYLLGDSGSMRKGGVYEDYLRMCETRGMKPMTAPVFGKFVKRAFPDVKSNRKGPRGNTSHHYTGLRYKQPANGRAKSSRPEPVAPLQFVWEAGCKQEYASLGSGPPQRSAHNNNMLGATAQNQGQQLPQQQDQTSGRYQPYPPPSGALGKSPPSAASSAYYHLDRRRRSTSEPPRPMAPSAESCSFAHNSDDELGRFSAMSQVYSEEMAPWYERSERIAHQAPVPRGYEQRETSLARSGDDKNTISGTARAGEAAEAAQLQALAENSVTRDDHLPSLPPFASLSSLSAFLENSSTIGRNGQSTSQPSPNANFFASWGSLGSLSSLGRYSESGAALTPQSSLSFVNGFMAPGAGDASGTIMSSASETNLQGANNDNIACSAPALGRTALSDLSPETLARTIRRTSLIAEDTGYGRPSSAVQPMSIASTTNQPQQPPKNIASTRSQSIPGESSDETLPCVTELGYRPQLNLVAPAAPISASAFPLLTNFEFRYPGLLVDRGITQQEEEKLMQCFQSLSFSYRSYHQRLLGAIIARDTESVVKVIFDFWRQDILEALPFVLKTHRNAALTQAESGRDLSPHQPSQHQQGSSAKAEHPLQANLLLTSVAQQMCVIDENALREIGDMIMCNPGRWSETELSEWLFVCSQMIASWYQLALKQTFRPCENAEHTPSSSSSSSLQAATRGTAASGDQSKAQAMEVTIFPPYFIDMKLDRINKFCGLLGRRASFIRRLCTGHTGESVNV